MKIVKTWCENTEEGKDYLEYNGYQPIRRLTKDLWLVKKNWKQTGRCRNYIDET